MKRPFTLATLLLSSLAWATPPASDSSLVVAAESVLQKELMQPLALQDSKQSRLSRALLPPQARRLRILDTRPRQDAQGHWFVTFAVDTRQGYAASSDDEKTWHSATLTGCVYPERHEVFVKRNNVYRSADLLLGKKTPAPPDTVCQDFRAPR